MCEVLSPATAAMDCVKELGVYAREGVSHAWLVDPIAGLPPCLDEEPPIWT
jgi:Uma2 family endonuclease